MEIMTDQVLERHVDDLRAPYLEGLLSPEERSNFEDHVRQCPACTSRLKEMSRWVSVFKDNAREMCPDGWELFDYVRSGKDPRGMMSSHLETCASCRSDAESFRADASKQTMPADLWQKMKSLSGRRPAGRGAERSYQWISDVVDRIMDLFRPAVLVPLAVAASVFIMVLLYPFGPAPIKVALSSVNWGPEPSSLNIMGSESPTSLPAEAKRERLGVMILFSNVEQIPGQNRIDSFYRALEPPRNIRDRYQVVSPMELGRAAGKDLLRAADEKALIAIMRSKLSISKALVVEITPKEDRYTILARLIETGSGRVIRTWNSGKLTKAELISALEDSTQSLFRP
jgi:hypothetical protein